MNDLRTTPGPILTQEHLEEHGLMAPLKAIYSLGDPDDTEQYDNWENAWHELVTWTRDTYFHRYDYLDFEEQLNHILDK